MKPTDVSHTGVVDETTVIEDLLFEVRERRGEASHGWRATWLLTDIHASKWEVRAFDPRIRDGKVQTTIFIAWNDQLPDGTSLADNINQSFREFLQKAAFLIREDSSIQSAISFVGQVGYLKLLARWLFRFKTRYQPHTNNFERFDRRAIKRFLDEFVEGGGFDTSGCAISFLGKLEELTNIDGLSNHIDSVFEIPQDKVKAAITWLTANGFYIKTKGNGPNAGLQRLDRIKLSRFLSIDVAILNSERAIAFFRQFEPEYQKKFPGLCVRTSPIEQKHLSHRIKLIKDVVASRQTEGAVNQVIAVLGKLQNLEKRLPTTIPKLSDYQQKAVYGSCMKKAEIGESTPWIPIQVSLAYLNESLRWVVDYGSTLVDFYFTALAHFEAAGLRGKKSDSEREARERWTRENIPEKLISIGITGWGPNGNTRDHLGLSNAMSILVGACVYLITGLAPSRIREVSALEKECITAISGDGFWMDKRRGKVVVNDQHADMRVPIPKACVIAIRLLTRLGVTAKGYSTTFDPALEHYLLYLPNFAVLGNLSFSLKGPKGVDYALDVFCDRVGIPPDAEGRRWYVRVHENRKSFLLAFFWCFKFAILDAARMLAGHSDERMILAYIRRHFPETSISELEADYLSRALWDFASTNGGVKSIENIDALYKRVCRHFGVFEISELSESKVKDWLEFCIEQGQYSIQMIQVLTKSYRVRVALRIKFRKTTPNKGDQS
jgi:hypothetical protein